MQNICLNDLIDMAQQPFTLQYIKVYLTNLEEIYHQKLFVQNPKQYKQLIQKIGLKISKFDMYPNQCTELQLFPTFTPEVFCKQAEQPKVETIFIQPEQTVYNEQQFEIMLVQQISSLSVGQHGLFLINNQFIELTNNNNVVNSNFEEILTKNTTYDKSEQVSQQDILSYNPLAPYRRQGFIYGINLILSKCAQQQKKYAGMPVQLSFLHKTYVNESEFSTLNTFEVVAYLVFLLTKFNVISQIQEQSRLQLLQLFDIDKFLDQFNPSQILQLQNEYSQNIQLKYKQTQLANKVFKMQFVDGIVFE